MKILKLNKKILLFFLLILTTSSVVYAKEFELKYNYDTKDKIPESVQMDDKTIVPLYRFDKTVNNTYEAVYRQQTKEELKKASEASSYSDVFYKVVSIPYFYSTFDTVPETHTYKEYNKTYSCWFNGTLELEAVVKSESMCKATYSGYVHYSGLQQ
jgi:hypothetical protein